MSEANAGAEPTGRGRALPGRVLTLVSRSARVTVVTAEITVMNPQAVALAADSAVTVTSGDGSKAWQSANKIFGLSRHHPVGVMVWGGAEFMRVPWDVVIKRYRDQLASRPFGTLAEYTRDLQRFITRQRSVFDADEQDVYVYNKAAGYFIEILGEIEQTAAEAIKNSASAGVTTAELSAIVDGVVRQRQEELEEAENLRGVPTTYRRRLTSTYSRTIGRAKRDVFQQLPLSSGTSRRLSSIAYLLFERAVFMPNMSGLVVAGYGDDEIFPSVHSIRLDGIAAGRLVAHADEPATISRDNRSWIRPFAQSDAVAAFMEGVDPGYQQVIEMAVATMLTQYPKSILDTITGLSSRRRTALEKSLETSAGQTFAEFRRALAEIRRDHFWARVVQVVGVLPKDELATMAETLVSLTSFRHKVSMDVESVGGPIDVAVISKGDGFVWIKRKNYFQLDQNPHFAAKYNRS